MELNIRAKTNIDDGNLSSDLTPFIQDTDISSPDFFNPTSFRAQANLIISKLTDYLSDTSLRGLALEDPAVLLKAARDLTEGDPESVDASVLERLERMVDLYIKTGIQVHSPGFMGRQFSGVAPLAGIFDIIGSIVNQPASFYEAGQLPNVIERVMGDELNGLIGWKQDYACMVTTSGGSLANMTALLAARNHHLPGVWSSGLSFLAQERRPAIAMSEDAHYSLYRAAGILGIGDRQIVRLPINEKRQIRIDMVEPTLDKAKQEGLDVFCLVASAGSTSVGAFDPLEKIAAIAKKKNIWLHVDGAHGASLLVSDTLRHKLRGIENADSLTWDAHKMMFVPPACTLLFYKDKHKSYGAFRQQASYVFEKEPDIYSQYQSAEQNFECTKRPMIMALWVLWALHGRAFFAEKIESLIHLTRRAYDIVDNQPDFVPVHYPEANIFCFRYLPAGLQTDEVSDFQVAIRNRLREEGRFFISKIDIDGVGALRVVFTNHRTKASHFRMLLSEIRRIGQDLMEGARVDA